MITLRKYFYQMMDTVGEDLTDSQMLANFYDAANDGTRSLPDGLADILSQYREQDTDYHGDLIDAIHFFYQEHE